MAERFVVHFPGCYLGYHRVVHLLGGYGTDGVGRAGGSVRHAVGNLAGVVLFPTFNALRVIPNKLLGVLSMAAVPVGLITVPFLESINKFQNPFRRPVATTVFLIGTFYAIWMGIGATMPIDKAISLGVF